MLIMHTLSALYNRIKCFAYTLTDILNYITYNMIPIAVFFNLKTFKKREGRKRSLNGIYFRWNLTHDLSCMNEFR